MKFSKLITIALFSIGFSSHALAGMFIPVLPYNTSSDTTTENRAYAGLVWALKDKTSWIPDLTFGLRSLRVKSNDNVQGADISARVRLNGGIAFDSTRLVYVGGERDILGNIGFGYSNTSSSFLGTLGIQGPYMRLGTDLEFNNKNFVPYLELLTVDKPNNVNKTKSCPTNYSNTGTQCQLNPV